MYIAVIRSQKSIIMTDKFNFITDKQLKECLKEVLKEFFTENTVRSVAEEPQTKIVDLDGLIKARPFVGSKSTIYKKVYQGKIPYSKQGKRLIFDLEEIDNWLLSNKSVVSDKLEEATLEYFRKRQNKSRHRG